MYSSFRLVCIDSALLTTILFANSSTIQIYNNQTCFICTQIKIQKAYAQSSAIQIEAQGKSDAVLIEARAYANARKIEVPPFTKQKV